MYSRVTEFQSTSKTHCDMIIAFFQNVMIPRNLKNGMLSSEIYRVSDTEGFLMSTFKSKNDANSIMKMVANEINEVKGNIKIKFIEGEWVFRADQWCAFKKYLTMMVTILKNVYNYKNLQ